MALTSRTLSLRRTGELPEFPDLPTFVPPKVDVGRIRQLAQEEAAPSLRRERFQTIRGLQEARAEGERRGNPLAGFLRRRVLEARGQTIADITAGAGRRAQELFRPEFAASVEAERSRIEGAREKARRDFDLRVREFFDTRTGKVAPRPTRRPTRFVSSGGFGTGGGTGSFATTAEALRHFTGAGRGGAPQQASSQTYWASDADQRSAIKLSEATGRPLSDFYTGAIATIEQKATLGQTTANRDFKAKYGL